MCALYMCGKVNICIYFHIGTSLVAQTVKASAYNAGDQDSVPGMRRSPGGGNGNPLQYSCLENLMDREAWQARVYGVTKCQTQLSDFTFTFHINVTAVVYNKICTRTKQSKA